MKIAAGGGAVDAPARPCCSRCSRSGRNNDQTPTAHRHPPLLSILATGTWNGKVVGLNPLNAQYQQQFGPGDYVPNVFIQYWGMRVMAYGGTIVVWSRCGGHGCCCGAARAPGCG